MDYDLCIIGAGWAGFNAALSAARLGKKVCLIEERQIGGTCLNKGCIPTKALIHYSKQGLTLSEIQKKKAACVLRLKSGMSYLLKSHKVDYLEAKARIEKDGSVSINENKTYKPKFILIATGSLPRELPDLKFDHQKVISSDDVLNLEKLPKKILIVGAGAIGCEFANIFKRLGAQVTIVEIMPQLLPGFDIEVSKKLQQSYQKAGITIYVGKSAREFKLNDYDKVLLAVGRQAKIDGIWGKEIEIKVEKGSICVDKELKTSAPHIFAAGDCIGGYMLAHVASYEGELAVNNMFLEPRQRDYSSVPSSVFSSPEVSCIGASEEEVKKSGIGYKANTVHFLSIGIAHILEDTDGFVKVICEEKTGRILGASIIGLQATELVNGFSILMKNNVTIKALRNTIFAHPSVSEIIAEVAKAFA